MNWRCWVGRHSWDYAKSELQNTRGQRLWFRTRRCGCGRFEYFNDLAKVPTWRPIEESA